MTQHFQCALLTGQGRETAPSLARMLQKAAEQMGVEMVSPKQTQAEPQQCLLCQIPIRLDSRCQYLSSDQKMQEGRKSTLACFRET